MEGMRFEVFGRVQGVGFRAWTRSVAQRAGLVGSVRNQPSGSVLIDAAGEAAALQKFRGAVRVGPPDAKVEFVTESPIHIPDAADFVIEY
jgi:acylphosphatase